MEKTKGNQLISERMRDIGISSNQLSLLSGVSNAHLRQILEGVTRRPGRNILIRLALGLSWSVGGISALLRAYDQEDLSDDDDAYFKEAVRKRRNPSGYNAIHPGGFNFETAIMSLEKMAGPVRLVTPVPHVVFRDFDDYFSKIMVSDTERGNDVYREIRRFLFEKRIKMFNDNIRKHRVSHLMCRDCLASYIKRRRENTDTEDIAGEFENIFRGMANENYDLRLTERCPCFKFHIAEPETGKPGIVFSGNSPHPSSSCTPAHGETTGALIGFVSDSEELLEHFVTEFERLNRAVTEESADKKRLMQYIIDLLEKNGINGEWKI